MNELGIVAAAVLAAGVACYACWRLAGTSPAPTPAPAETVAETPAEPESENTPPRVPPEEVVTRIFVVDLLTEEPVERFGMSIRRGSMTDARTGDPIVPPRIEEFPGGALLVPAPLEGYAYSVRAPGYVPRSRPIEPSPAHLFIIELEPFASITGRVLVDGEPRAGARVSVVRREFGYLGGVGNRRSETTDEEGRFALDRLCAGTYFLSVYGSKIEPVPEKLEIELGVGEVRDVGDLSRVERVVPEPIFGDFFDAAAASEDRQGQLDDPYSWYGSGLEPKSPHVPYGTRKGPSRFGPGRVGELPRPVDAPIRVQALDGDRPLAGVAVFLQSGRRPVPVEVGMTDDAGEVLLNLQPTEIGQFILRTPGGLPLGRTEQAVVPASGQNSSVVVQLRPTSVRPLGPSSHRLAQKTSSPTPE